MKCPTTQAPRGVQPSTTSNKDTTAPAGYTVAIDQDLIDSGNQDEVSFTITHQEDTDLSAVALLLDGRLYQQEVAAYLDGVALVPAPAEELRRAADALALLDEAVRRFPAGDRIDQAI